MKRKGILLFTIITLLVALIASVCDAGAYVYSSKRKRINCAVLTDDYFLPTNRDNLRYLFEALDQESYIKPAGWSFANPLSAIRENYDVLSPKDHVDYWLIDINSVDDLSALDVIYFPVWSSTSLSFQTREKLRRFVDIGGVLWIDNVSGASGTVSFNDTFFIENFSFASVSESYEVCPQDSRHHPLMTSPLWIDDQEVYSLGYYPGRYVCHPGFNLDGWSRNSFNPEALLPVIINQGRNLSSIAANPYGSGAVVATSTGVGYACVELNRLFATSSYKLAYNIMAYNASFMSHRKDMRRNASSIDIVGGTKLTEKWKDQGIGSPLPFIEYSPVVYKGIVFQSQGTVLNAFEVNPDGGANLMWHEDLGVPISSPAVQSTLNPSLFGSGGSSGSTTLDIVAVTTATNDIHFFNVLDGGSPGITSVRMDVLDDNTSTETNYPYPPIYVNGWVYAVGSDGRLHAYNPILEKESDNNLSFEYQMPFTEGSVQINGAPRSAPVFGYTKNETNGAIVGTVYWGATELLMNNAQSSGNADCIYSIPVFVANDKLKVKQWVEGDILCETSYKNAAITETPEMKIWYRADNGDIEPIDSEHIHVNYGDIEGQIRITQQSLPPDTIFYATYHLDYARRNASVKSVASPNKITLTPASGAPESDPTGLPFTKLTGTPALDSDDTLFATGTRIDSLPNQDGSIRPDSVYGIKLEGNNTQATKWNYMIHAGISANGKDIPSSLIYKIKDNAGVDLIKEFVEPRVSSSPAVSNGKVFVTVREENTQNDPVRGAIMCFKAQSDFVISLTESAGGFEGGSALTSPMSLIDQSTGRRKSVKIWQPNLLSNQISGPPVQLATNVPSEMIDYDRGTITINNFDRIKLRGASDVVNGMLTPSLPVWVFVDNNEIPVDYSTFAPIVAADQMVGSSTSPINSNRVDLSSWNNLLWYYVIEDTSFSSSPIVIGNTLYAITDRGNVISLNAETGETQGSQTSQDFIWQSDDGNNSLSPDYRFSPAAASGTLLVPSINGLKAFSNATTLVADESRIMEINSAGEFSWMADSVYIPASVPEDGNSRLPMVEKDLVNPGNAKYLTSNELLVVNTGGNFVCRIDKSATVSTYRAVEAATNKTRYIRWIYDKFSDPKGLLPSGQPLTLRNPSDAIIWTERETVSGQTHTVVHCMIADSGNYRILDLIYRFDEKGQIRTDGTRQEERKTTYPNENYLDSTSRYVLPELAWVTKTDAVDKRFTFNSIQIPERDGDGTELVWASVSNYRSVANEAYSSAPGGSIVGIEYRKVNNNGTIDYNLPFSGEVVARCDSLNIGGTTRVLANPRFFQVHDADDGRRLLICDNNGIYYTNPIGASSTPTVYAYLLDDQYRRYLRNVPVVGNSPDPNNEEALSVPLMATSVQLQPNGNWLITNNYIGSSLLYERSFTGEVFEYDPLDGNIIWSSSEFEIDSNTGTWYQKTNLNKPRFAVRRED